MNKYNTFYDYIDAFQSGYDNVLNDLITYYVIEERNGQKDKDKIYKLKFNDKKLNQFLHDFKIKFAWVDDNDIQSWFLNALFGDKEGQGILYQADLNMTPQQLINWTRQRIDGHIKNKINQEQLYGNNDGLEVVSDTFQTEDEEYTITDTDGTQYDNREEYSYQNAYQEFLGAIGGIKQFLSKREYDIHIMTNEQDATEQKIADDLNISQQSVSKTKKRAMNKIKKVYLEFQQYKILAKDNGDTYQKVNNFIKEFNTIMDYASDGFDYFKYIIKWLEDKQTYEDSQCDYNLLQQNKTKHTLTVIDALVDNLLPAQHNLVAEVLQSNVYDNERVMFTQVQKDRFVNAVTRSFNVYLKQVNETIESMSNIFIHNINEQEYENIAKLFIS